jgi:trk system potassium uptake protein TrkH
MLLRWISEQSPWFRKNEDRLRIATNIIIFTLSLIAFIVAIWDTGFFQSVMLQHRIDHFYKVYFAFNGLLYVLRSLLFLKERKSSIVSLTNLVLGALLLFEFSLSLILGKPYILSPLLHLPPVYKSLAVLLFIFEFSRLDLFRFLALLNPPQIFIVSFGSLIITGALFLMMPQATTQPLRFIDAFFTSTSAVCVTGHIVVDTATRFTLYGKSVILVLLQLGGLGIMTFTSFFAVFFKGTQSFREKQILKEWLSDPNLSGIKRTLSKIVLFVFMAEAAGTLFIYLSTDPALFEGSQRFRFAVFHAISAFCNAGFSTLTDGIYDFRVRSNIPFLYIMSGLIVLGGLGFPVVLNVYEFFKAKIRNRIEQRSRRYRYVPSFGLININSRIVLLTTAFLIILGAAAFFLFENNHTLAGKATGEKIAVSILSSVTPRTAGFNAVSMSMITLPTIMLTILLMWIGASPVSTGGGIKTTTFAMAIINMFKIIKGKDRIDIFQREIEPGAVNRAFAIMFFSFIILGIGSMIIYLIEPGQGLIKIVFECFSAYGTVGLSLGITPTLTTASKMIIILLMFLGRMGTITLLMVFISQPKSRPYRFPSDTILIT